MNDGRIVATVDISHIQDALSNIIERVSNGESGDDVRQDTLSMLDMEPIINFEVVSHEEAGRREAEELCRLQEGICSDAMAAGPDHMRMAIELFEAQWAQHAAEFRSVSANDVVEPYGDDMPGMTIGEFQKWSDEIIREVKGAE